MMDTRLSITFRIKEMEYYALPHVNYYVIEADCSCTQRV